MKKYIMTGLVALAMTVSSCESNFDSLNVNPNEPTPENIAPSYLISPVLVRATLEVNTYQRIHNLYNDTFSQYFANDKYTSNVCVPNDDWSQDYWNRVWGWVAALNEVVANYGDDVRYNNQVQISRIWRAWIFSRTTDLFGDIPYSEACNNSGQAAKYDTQKEIYYDMIKELAEASEKLNPGGDNMGNADLIFGGDVARWKQFANSLRLRFAMRMTEADPAKAKAEAEAAVKAPGGLLSSIDDDVKIKRLENYYQIDGGGFYYSASNLYGRGRMTMSSSMQKLMTGLGGQPFLTKPEYRNVPEYVDPRGPIYFNVTSTYTGADAAHCGQWKGVTPGLTKAVGSELDNSRTNNSRLGVHFVANTDNADAPFEVDANKQQTLMYYSEVCFLKAEAALRGYNVGGTAESFYNEGVKASMKEVEIDDATINAYMTSTMANDYGTTVPFNDQTSAPRNSQLAKIMTQKYLANFPDNSWEAWNDYRRTGMPTLDPFAMPETGYVIQKGAMDWKGSLRRIIYPANEKIVNEANYNEAVKRMDGGDKTTTRMWWDSRTTVVE